MASAATGSGGRNRKRGDDRGDPLASLTWEGNPHARRAYCFSMVGLIPVLGLFLGPLAVLFGALGRRTAKLDPLQRGSSHAALGMALGAIEFAVNVVGLSFIALGLGWF